MLLPASASANVIGKKSTKLSQVKKMPRRLPPVEANTSK
jgi:hypothetical protein